MAYRIRHPKPGNAALRQLENTGSFGLPVLPHCKEINVERQNHEKAAQTIARIYYAFKLWHFWHNKLL